ncbi:unnamed protein product [Orchesella dallaii]|uniref:BEN domain-containing protein n=1 Tax=Orchesella dallaii TaxID=48710 RepID=A0ABP1Q965_9HEXA
MRRSVNGGKTGPASTVKQNSGGGGTASKRGVSTDENNANADVKNVLTCDEDNHVQAMAGPVTARLKMLEKKCSQILDMQMKFNILDKWITQQFGIKLFPPEVVNMEKLANGNPEDVDNPFYAVYLVCQRVKFLEEKVKKLEARPYEDMGELKPTSNYSSSHAFRNFKGQGKSSGGGGVKRTYGNSSPSTPKKPKLIPRPAPPSSNYPFKPSVKILPKDPNAVTPSKKDTSEQLDLAKASSSPKKSVAVEEKEPESKQESIDGKEQVLDEKSVSSENQAKESSDDNAKDKVTPDPQDESKDTTVEGMDIEKSAVDIPKEDSTSADQQEKPVEESSVEAAAAEMSVIKQEDMSADEAIGEDAVPEVLGEKSVAASEKESLSEDALLFDDSAPVADDMMEFESGQEESEMEIEQKPVLPLEEDLGGDISGSEASVSSLASSSSKPRLSTRRKKGAMAAAAAASGGTGKHSEEEKPVMYTARGRRHTVPRRYAEFTGHDNVVSILKSQQRAEKSAAAAASAAGSSKGGKRQSVTPTKTQDTPPRIRKMVKTPKTPSPKKAALTDSDGDGDFREGKKKSGSGSSSSTLPQDRPPCVDVLVDKVMGREVDSDGMVVLSESYPNIFVNQQQLVAVIVKSNGKSTRLTRKMTTLVFEDSVLASASPFGTKYYKDRLPPEPLEAMVDFIADSGFEPHYSKKKIYMIVGQVCNEARAGRVSRKFMQPLEPGTSASGQPLDCISEASSPASQSTPP